MIRRWSGCQYHGPNAPGLGRALDALAGTSDKADRDPAAALELIHPDIFWAPSSWSGSGVLRGSRAVQGWFDQFGPTPEDLNIDVSEIRVGQMHDPESWVVVLGTVHDPRESQPFATVVGWRFAVYQGMVIEGHSHPTWEEALQAAGVVR